MIERTEILNQVNAIFKEVLKKSDLQLTEATTADDIYEWDSLNHAILMVRVQAHFKIKCSIGELVRLETIGDLCDLIASKVE